MIFSPPPELEFIERGFGFSPAHEPDEAVISYVRNYQDGKELTITFTIGSMPSVFVALSSGSEILLGLTLDWVNEVLFQSWNGEAVIRMHFADTMKNADVRVHYAPKPSIHYASLA